MPTEHNCIQGELDWLRLRLGKPTASEFSKIMTPFLVKSEGEVAHKYLCEKLAEKILGHALPGGFEGTHDTEQGDILEAEARGWFGIERDCEVRQIGFVTSDDGRCGCSPDGLIGEDAGLELKCPLAQTHIRYLLAATVPKEYAAQVHGSLYVTGRKRWYFLSYRRGFPKLVVTVERDEAIMRKIGAALSSFYSDFDSALKKLGHEPKGTTPVGGLGAP